MSHEHCIQSLSWGIGDFDRVTRGLPLGDVSVIETPDYHSGQVILGQYLYEGLAKGEQCVLLTFDSASVFLQNFLKWNWDFEKYLDNEQLVLLNYRPNITTEIGLTYHYNPIFEEMVRLSKGKTPDRIAIQQIDTLINLNNILLINNSANKLAVASRQGAGKASSILGYYVQFQDQVHKDLSIALQKTMGAYFVLERPDELKPYEFTFYTKKIPWFDYDLFPVRVELVNGKGFLSRETLAA